MPEKQTFPEIRNAILSWFAANQRPLPWRQHITPYRIWISEIMLQQTQMERGVAYFQRWMALFPNIHSVAEADESSLLKAWEGLGYYSRARNIQAAARIIMRHHGGVFPSRHEDILSLPGIGPYTAGAIASIAFNQDVPCVDGNVERVFSRLFNIESPVREEPAKKYIAALARDMLPPGQAGQFNQALMEFGALVCRKKPVCAVCPLQTWCMAHQQNCAPERPVRGKRPSTVTQNMVAGVLQRSRTVGTSKTGRNEEMAGEILLHFRNNTKLWNGLWEFPAGEAATNEPPETAVLRIFREQFGLVNLQIVKKLIVIRHSFTTHRVRLHCFLLRFSPADPASTATDKTVCETRTDQTESTLRWIAAGEIDSLPMPAPHRRLAENPVFFDNLQKKA